MSSYSVITDADTYCNTCILHDFVHSLLNVLIQTNQEINGSLIVTFLKLNLNQILENIRIYVIAAPATHDIYFNNFFIKIHSSTHSVLFFKLLYNKVSSLENISAKKVALFIRNKNKLKTLSSDLLLPKIIENIIESVLFE